MGTDEVKGMESGVSEIEYVGPFEHHEVVVNGWTVPHLTSTPLQGGRIHLSLDSRFGLELMLQDAERVVPFIAHCIAVASGYTGHPGEDGFDEPRHAHPMTRLRRLDI